MQPPLRITAPSDAHRPPSRLLALSLTSHVTLVQFYYVPQPELPYLQNGHNKSTGPMRIMEITHDTPRRGSGTQQHFHISCYSGDSMVPCGRLCLRLGLQHASLSQRAGTITSAQVRCYKVYQELLM